MLDGFSLNRCINCGMVVAFPVDSAAKWHDFTDFGDYLLLDRQSAETRIAGLSRRMEPTFEYIKNRYANPKVLEFGAGGGFLSKAAQRAGLNIAGIEPSEKLRRYSRKHLGLDNMFESVFDLEGETFDAVLTYDVLEHLTPYESKAIMKHLVSLMKPGGLLIGQTPNFNSANIRLFGTKDPVVCPPSHSCYFTVPTLQKYCEYLGLKKRRLYSTGLSTNSFFRKQKFERSFLETGQLLPIAVSIRAAFRLLGVAVQPFDLGYQIRFLYKKG